ncbi:MAG: FdtA/QdtA family cupin domain-containing protein [Pseudolysinimonas sp.]
MTGDPLGEVRGARLVRLQRVDADNGSVVIAQTPDQLPFAVERIFTLFGVPGGELRGTHAHRECHQFLIAEHGSVRARVDDGTHVAEVLLDSPDLGLYMPPLIWGAQFEYSADAVLLVLASHRYDRADYIEDYAEFGSLAAGRTDA